MMRDYGLQLYSVRDFTAKDLDNTLKKVAEMGYTSVEFAGFFGHSAEEVKHMLETYGLAVSGTHSGFEDLEKDFAGTVAYHHAIGNRNYIVPGAPWQTARELAETVEKMNRFQPLLAREGIRLAYHNHSGEFLPNADGQIPHEVMQKETDLDFEIDTFWAFAAGRDPVKTVRDLGSRVTFIHLKDGMRNGDGFALGEGEAPVTAVRDMAIELDIPMVVESETLQPDGLSEVRRCIDYLRTLEEK